MRKVRGTASSRVTGSHDAEVTRWASARLRYVDNLKVILIAAIIVGHAVSGYGELDWWAYADQRETTLSPVTQAIVLAVGGPFAMLLIPVLFLVAGLMTPPSLARKHPGPYVRDRLLRLGIVFAVYVLVLLPLTMYVLEHWIGTDTGSYWSSYFGAEKTLDTGTLWFVGDLLLFTLAYTGWTVARRRLATRSAVHEITARQLALVSVVVAVTTFLVRLVFPFNSENRYLDLNFYQWPACIAIFAVGIVASRADWLTAVPDRLRRISGVVTLVALAAFGGFVLVGVSESGIGEEAWTGGWDWSAMMFPVIESPLVVFGPIWLLGLAQRRLARQVPWIRPPVIRACFGAFVLQQVVLVLLAIALRPVPLPAELKALAVATGGVILCFALAWLLITRIPGLSRVL
ncbi:acyltransferase [Kribbella sp. NPDC003505]|uniref:acyltransferase family protein n=1 Tax=Kribbella sp. NPDC003505 TaxID=3154448 RepID=UPI0033A8785F